MRAELRDLLTVDHDTLDALQPATDVFCISLRALIGPAGSEGEESFDFDVCSPAWLDAEAEKRPVISGRFLLITRRFNPELIEEYLRKRVAEATGHDWPSIAAKLARWSRWEFEDYRER
jgi:hypothetical protein